MAKAVVNQVSFRGRDDDVGIDSTTWDYAEGADWTQDADVNFRVRFQIEETAAGTVAISPQLEYYHAEGTATWTNVTTTSSVVRAFASGHASFNDGDLIGSHQLTVSAQTANSPIEGSGSEDGLGTDFTIDATYDEVEFCVQLRSVDVSDADTVYIKVTNAGADFDSYGAGSDPALANIPVLTANVVPLPDDEKHAATILLTASGAMTGRVYV